MKTRFAILAFLALTAPAMAQAERPVAKGTGDCMPSMGLNFLCGLNQPEDIIQIGTSKWLVASGMGKGGGISLIDTAVKTARPGRNFRVAGLGVVSVWMNIGWNSRYGRR